MCSISDESEVNTYTLFDLSESKCENEDVKLSQIEDSSSRFSYMVFLFTTASSDTNYHLNCDIVVCVKGNAESECATFDANCDA